MSNLRGHHLWLVRTEHTVHWSVIVVVLITTSLFILAPITSNGFMLFDETRYKKLYLTSVYM